MALDTYNAGIADMDKRNYDESLASAMQEEGLAALKTMVDIGGDMVPVYEHRDPSQTQRQALSNAQFNAAKRQVAKHQRKIDAGEMGTIDNKHGTGVSLLDIAAERASGTSVYELNKQYRTGPISKAMIDNQAENSGRRHGALATQDYLKSITTDPDTVKDSIRNLNTEYSLKKVTELEEEMKDANLDDLIQSWAQLIGMYRQKRDNFGI